MPNGPMLGAHHGDRAPHATGLSLDRALGSSRTAPTDAYSEAEADHMGVHNRIVFGESCAA